MTGTQTHAEILRSVAIAAVKDARAAQKTARKKPGEDHLRAAYQASVFAARALLRASEENPGDEDAMIELSILIREEAAALQAKLVRKIVE